MREQIKDKGRISHMLEMALLLENEKSHHTLEDLRADKVLFYGLSKMVEIIGEAAYKVTNEFKNENSELPWKQMMGMRHILVHGYFSISPEVLWDVIINDIPSLIPTLRRYLDKLE
mgnify:CR=1 FL=1